MNFCCFEACEGVFNFYRQGTVGGAGGTELATFGENFAASEDIYHKRDEDAKDVSLGKMVSEGEWSSLPAPCRDVNEDYAEDHPIDIDPAPKLYNRVSFVYVLGSQALGELTVAGPYIVPLAGVLMKIYTKATMNGKP